MAKLETLCEVNLGLGWIPFQLHTAGQTQYQLSSNHNEMHNGHITAIVLVCIPEQNPMFTLT